MIYLIDTENVAGGWIGLAMERHAEDPAALFYVLYTDSTPRLSYDEAAAIAMNLGPCITFCKCSKGKANALDFRLVAQVGILAVSMPGSEFCIVSNDKGFDEAVAAYSSSGIRVSRLCCSNKSVIDAPMGVCARAAEELTAAREAPAEAAEEPAEAPPAEPAQQAAMSMTDREKTLHEKQRRYLSAYCSVPKVMAEAVRNALLKGTDNAEKTIRNSRSKAFSGSPEDRENAIRCIREHYEDYLALQA